MISPGRILLELGKGMWFADYIHIMVSSWMIRNFIPFNINQMFRSIRKIPWAI